jgi:hypothetical protein
MKTPRNSFKTPRGTFRSGLVLFLALAAARSLPADTLTGTVWQPTARIGARASSVRVIDQDTEKTLAGWDTTDARGIYSFEGIPSGRRIAIKAKWDSTRSLPGESLTSVDANPKRADVQLLPPPDASPQDWYTAGRQSTDIGSGVTGIVPKSLQLNIEVRRKLQKYFKAGAAGMHYHPTGSAPNEGTGKAAAIDKNGHRTPVKSAPTPAGVTTARSTNSASQPAPIGQPPGGPGAWHGGEPPGHTMLGPLR